MSSPSEALVINPVYNWQYNPVITTYAPRGDAIASWWTGERPTWLYQVISWFTAYEAQGNASTNTRVELKNLRVYILSNSTRKWTQVDVRTDFSETTSMGLWTYPFNGGSSATDKKAEPDGGTSVRPVYPNFYHGYGHPKAIATPSDVRAVFAAMDFRLVVADSSKPDDRSKAKYVVDAGADYYPDANMHWSLGYAPGVGNGRYLLATPNYRTASLIVPNTGMGATMTELKSNPPPLN